MGPVGGLSITAPDAAPRAAGAPPRDGCGSRSTPTRSGPGTGSVGWSWNHGLRPGEHGELKPRPSDGDADVSRHRRAAWPDIGRRRRARARSAPGRRPNGGFSGCGGFGLAGLRPAPSETPLPVPNAVHGDAHDHASNRSARPSTAGGLSRAMPTRSASNPSLCTALPTASSPSAIAPWSDGKDPARLEGVRARVHARGATALET